MDDPYDCGRHPTEREIRDAERKRMATRIRGLEARVAALEEELSVADKLLDARREVLALIPSCPVHGLQCLPHCKEWIERAQAKMRGEDEG